jgi:hypothetical protein
VVADGPNKGGGHKHMGGLKIGHIGMFVAGGVVGYLVAKKWGK